MGASTLHLTQLEMSLLCCFMHFHHLLPKLPIHGALSSPKVWCQPKRMSLRYVLVCYLFMEIANLQALITQEICCSISPDVIVIINIYCR